MPSIYQKTPIFFENLLPKLRKAKYFIFPLFIILTVIAWFGIDRVKRVTSRESAFPQGDQVLKTLKQFKSEFGSHETLVIMYEARDGDIFSANSLKTLSLLHEELLAGQLEQGENPVPLNHIVEIKSLINASFQEVDGDNLYSRQFIGNRLPQTDQARDRLRKQALAHRDYPGTYLSEDLKYGFIQIKTDFGAIREEQVLDILEEDFLEDNSETEEGFDETEEAPIKFQSVEDHEYTEFLAAVKSRVMQPRFTDVFSFHWVGYTAIVAYITQIMSEEIGIIFGGLGLIIIITLWILFRSLSAVVWPLMVIVFTLIWTVGFVGWSQIEMGGMFEAIQFLVIVVGVGDAVHILSGYLFFRNHQLSHDDALKSALKKSGTACLLTTLTTMVGFGSLMFVPIRDIRFFGGIAALSVGIAYLFTIFLLPLLLDLWNPISKKQSAKLLQNPKRTIWVQSLINGIHQFNWNHPIPMIIGFLGVFLLGLFGATHISLDKDIIQDYPKDSWLRVDAELMETVVGGTQSLQIYIDLHEADALKDPEVLNKMDHLQQKLLNEQRELVVRGMSLVNVVKTTNQVLNENRAEMYKIPSDRKALEEVLFLFNNGNPDDRRNLVSDDYRKASIHLSVRNTRFTKYRDLIHLVESEKNQIFKPLVERYPKMDIRVTGPVVMEVHQELYVTESLYRSLFITLAVISVILLFLFGSIREGFLVALIPNLFPITIIFGLMGILGFPLDTFTLVVVPVVIGIAVDDTIHFLTHYKLELQKHGNVREALQHTLNEVGQAVIFTSLILSSGLFFMTWASSIPISRFGMLAGIAILAAMIADLFLLPALCQLLNVRFESSSGKNGGTTTLNLGKKEINFE